MVAIHYPDLGPGGHRRRASLVASGRGKQPFPRTLDHRGRRRPHASRSAATGIHERKRRSDRHVSSPWMDHSTGFAGRETENLSRSPALEKVLEAEQHPALDEENEN